MHSQRVTVQVTYVTVFTLVCFDVHLGADSVTLRVHTASVIPKALLFGKLLMAHVALELIVHQSLLPLLNLHHILILMLLLHVLVQVFEMII